MIDKICHECRRIFPVSDFLFAKEKPAGRCKECRTKKNLEDKGRRATKYIENREAIKARQLEYYEEDRDKIRNRKSEWYRRNKERISAEAKEKRKLNPELEQAKNLIRNYGITLEEREAVWEKQDYKCAICQKQKLEDEKNFPIDHCHDTGKIRGILCRNCNSGIGLLGDSIPTLEAALTYLRYHTENNLDNQGEK